MLRVVGLVGLIIVALHSASAQFCHTSYEQDPTRFRLCIDSVFGGSWFTSMNKSSADDRYSQVLRTLGVVYPKGIHIENVRHCISFKVPDTQLTRYILNCKSDFFVFEKIRFISGNSLCYFNGGLIDDENEFDALLKNKESSCDE